MDLRDKADVVYIAMCLWSEAEEGKGVFPLYC